MMRRTAVDMENSEQLVNGGGCLLPGISFAWEEIRVWLLFNPFLCIFLCPWFLCWIYGRG